MSTTAGVMLVHTKARALMEWLMPQLAKFPREHRHGISQHMGALAMQVHDALIAARHLSRQERISVLRDADIWLDQLRQYLQLAWQWRWVSDGQFRHATELTAELGRLLGGWRRSVPT